ncbi:hypothetical protein [Haloferula rosea]|uniref:Uncharacterized protein n=1 Tax=Haloferula rosea TaxID=490093 RepID=A0A934R8S1_9BACT|nr:hypothetical protein [Haloferula rosea]MBK1827324.1 hypothetical protein [Haloferula rosea]
MSKPFASVIQGHWLAVLRGFFRLGPGLGFVLWLLLFAVVESAKTVVEPLPAGAEGLPSPAEERVLGESPEE